MVGVWGSAWGEWRSVLACGGGMWREEWGRCGERNGGDVALQHTSFPHFLTPLTFLCISPTPLHIFLCCTLPFILLPISLLPPPTPQHTFLHLSPHLSSPSQSVTKLPRDEISVAKLLATTSPTKHHKGATKSLQRTSN